MSGRDKSCGENKAEKGHRGEEGHFFQPGGHWSRNLEEVRDCVVQRSGVSKSIPGGGTVWGKVSAGVADRLVAAFQHF